MKLLERQMLISEILTSSTEISGKSILFSDSKSLLRFSLIWVRSRFSLWIIHAIIEYISRRNLVCQQSAQQSSGIIRLRSWFNMPTDVALRNVILGQHKRHKFIIDIISSAAKYNNGESNSVAINTDLLFINRLRLIWAECLVVIVLIRSWWSLFSEIWMKIDSSLNRSRLSDTMK